MINKKMIGEALFAFRDKKDLSQSELSEKSGVPQPRISKYERGEQMPRADYFLALTDALGITPNDLYEYAGAWENLIKESKPKYEIDPFDKQVRELIKTIYDMDSNKRETLLKLAKVIIEENR